MMWSSSIHLLLFFWVCRVCVCVCTCMCVYECLHICEQMCGCGYRHMYVGMHLEGGSWGLELFFINFLPCSWDRVSQSNPEVDGITNLANQPTFGLLRLKSQVGWHTAHLVFTWVQGIWTLVLMFFRQALYPTEPPSQSSSAFSALSLHGSISSSLVLGYLPFLFYAMLFLASVIFSL